MDGNLTDDSALSSDEETLLNEIETLKAFNQDPEPCTVETNQISDPSDAIRLISSGFADVDATTSNLLGLNSLMMFNLKQLEKQVEDKLRENLSEQERLKSALHSLRLNAKPEKFASFLRCGMPFFCTPCGWSQRKNEDAKTQESLGYSTPMQHFAAIFPWSQADNAKMLELVQRFDKEQKLQKLEEKKERIKMKKGGVEVWSALRDQCDALQSDKNSELDEKNIDWMRVSTALDLDFSPTDCEYQWRSVLSPTLNQKQWSNDETMKLHRIVKEHNYQHWEKIAAELGTNRSPLACCYHFQRSQQNRFVPWTLEEIAKLKDTMNFVGPSSRLKSHAAMLSMDRSYLQVSSQIKRLKRNNHKRSVDWNLSSWNKSHFEKNLKKFKRRYAKDLEAQGFSYNTDVLLLKSVAQHDADWKKIVGDVRSLGDEQRAKQRFEFLIHFLANTMGIHGFQLTNSHSYYASKLLQVLEFMKDKPLVRYGVNFKKDDAVKSLLEIMVPVRSYSFGPRAVFYSELDKAPRMKNLSAFCHLLLVNVNPAGIGDRYLKLSDPVYHNTLGMDDLIDTMEKVPIPNYLFERFLMPPNLITLVGIRTLFLTRNLLLQQSTLPLTETNGTVMNPDIAEEDRIHFLQAKHLLKERMRTLFYLPIIMSKMPISSFPPTELNIMPKKPKSRPMSKRKRKSVMGELSHKRWKIDKMLREKERNDNQS